MFKTLTGFVGILSVLAQSNVIELRTANFEFQTYISAEAKIPEESVLEEEVANIDSLPIEPQSTLGNDLNAKESLYDELPEDLLNIRWCESHNRQFNEDGTVLRGVANRNDVGLFQISEEFHKQEADELGIDLHTLEGNITFALVLFSREGARPWYLSYDPVSKKCINGVVIPNS